jgi:uncharacterized protein YjbI with pentapeptide repeats
VTVAIACALLVPMSSVSAAPKPQPKPKNSLVVTVSGLTDGKTPVVTISGPKQTAASVTTFIRIIHKTTTLTGLAAGTYKISAQPVSNSAGAFEATVYSRNVILRATGTVKYTVVYAKKAGNPSTGALLPVTELSAEPGVGKLTVRWNTPTSNTAVKNASYVASTDPGGIACAIGRSPCTILGLSADTAYFVTVVATDGTGKTVTTKLATAVTPLRVGQTVIDGQVVGPGIDLSGKRLVGAKLSLIKLTGANLTNADLTSADLTSADMSYTNLSGAKLAAANLKGIKSGHISGIPASLPSDWKLINGYLVGDGANLTDADLRDQNLAGARMYGTSLRGANFTGADLRNVDGKDLRGLIFDGANLQSAQLAGVNLSGSSFKSVRMNGANLAGANLAQANMASAILTGADLSNANCSRTDLTATTLSAATVSGAGLADAILKSVVTGNVVGLPASLPSGWTTKVGYFIGPKSDLTGADLSNVDLTGQDLTAATLTSAVLRGAKLVNATLTAASVNLLDLSDAVLTSISATGLSGTPKALPSGWKFDKTSKSILPI